MYYLIRILSLVDSFYPVVQPFKTLFTVNTIDKHYYTDTRPVNSKQVEVLIVSRTVVYIHVHIILLV